MAALTPLRDQQSDLFGGCRRERVEECVVNKANNVKVIVNCNPDLWDA